MDFDVSPDLKKELKKIKKKDPVLAKKVQKLLSIFALNHLHPSLRNHKLSGFDDIWSISIDKSIRMIYKLDSIGAYFFDIGTHDQVYKK